MANIDLEIALVPFNMAGDPNQPLHRGGLKQIGVAFNGTPVYVGDFSGGMPTADLHTGVITLVNPAPNPPTKANYIIYKGAGRILMSPNFNWLAPDGQDGPGFLYIAQEY
jgi:hypothetical protein